MDINQLILSGNQCRELNQPEQALSYYAQAFSLDRKNPHAFNNYGNVLREMGDPAGALPFLQRAVQLDPTNTVAPFNVAVAMLLMGDYERGWPQYESRWQFEHLAGTLPGYAQPQWTGQDLKDKTILVLGEQGHGDNIQFVRFLGNLKNLGARVILQINNNLSPLLKNYPGIDEIVDAGQTQSHFDYWTPIMSVPGVLKIYLDNLPKTVQYIIPDQTVTAQWLKILGPKKKLRVGFCWTGRRDSWINQHKAMPINCMLDLIKKNPGYDWFNLQIDATAEETELMRQAGVAEYPGGIQNFSDTAGLISHMDVVVSVDTAVAHLSCSLGRPTWIMLSQYALDWRWLLDRDSSPWYSTARLFRQPTMGDWQSVTDKIHQYLSWFKI